MALEKCQFFNCSNLIASHCIILENCSVHLTCRTEEQVKQINADLLNQNTGEKIKKSIYDFFGGWGFFPEFY